MAEAFQEVLCREPFPQARGEPGSGWGREAALGPSCAVRGSVGAKGREEGPFPPRCRSGGGARVEQGFGQSPGGKGAALSGTGPGRECERSKGNPGLSTRPPAHLQFHKRGHLCWGGGCMAVGSSDRSFISRVTFTRLTPHGSLERLSRRPMAVLLHPLENRWPGSPTALAPGRGGKEGSLGWRLQGEAAWHKGPVLGKFRKT